MGWKFKLARAAAVFAVGKAVDRAMIGKKRSSRRKRKTTTRRRKR